MAGAMELTLAKATAIIDRGLKQAAALKIGISIAVVDQYGQLVRLERSDDAPLASPQIAEAKAITAMQLRRPTSELMKLGGEALRSLRDVVQFRMVVLPGGVPLVQGGTVIGAVGVTGGTDEQDDEIAKLIAA